MKRSVTSVLLALVMGAASMSVLANHAANNYSNYNIKVYAGNDGANFKVGAPSGTGWVHCGDNGNCPIAFPNPVDVSTPDQPSWSNFEVTYKDYRFAVVNPTADLTQAGKTDWLFSEGNMPGNQFAHPTLYITLYPYGMQVPTSCSVRVDHFDSNFTVCYALLAS